MTHLHDTVVVLPLFIVMCTINSLEPSVHIATLTSKWNLGIVSLRQHYIRLDEQSHCVKLALKVETSHINYGVQDSRTTDPPDHPRNHKIKTDFVV